MPELPEVETIARGLASRVTGDIIESIWLGRKPEPLKSPAREIAATVENTRIATVRRVGKHIVFDLERMDRVGRTLLSVKSQNPEKSPKRSARNSKHHSSSLPAEADMSVRPTQHWIVHLGMTGRLQVCDAQSEILKHTHAILKLASGRELRFVDPRRFGRLALVSEPFTGPGSEPLTITKPAFAALFGGRKLSIKAALLNQSLLHGVGNIYADESLFRAGIRPTRQAGRLPRKRLDRLHTALRSVLRAAIRAGGSSVSDYVDANGDRGFFQIQHCVYMRTGEPCLVCGTPIRRVVLAGRGTHFCPVCQK